MQLVVDCRVKPGNDERGVVPEVLMLKAKGPGFLPGLRFLRQWLD
jgi:hypothetical protein